MVVITILLVAALAVPRIIVLSRRIVDKAKVQTEQIFKNAEAEQLMAKMIEAYKNTNTYLAEFKEVQLFDTEEEYDSRRRLIAFDRVDNKLRIESQGPYFNMSGKEVNRPILVVSDGKKLWHWDPRLTTASRQRHVEIELKKPLTYSYLMIVAVPYDDYNWPYIPLLFGHNPVDFLKRVTESEDLKVETVQPRQYDPLGRLGLRFTCFNKAWHHMFESLTYWLDKESYLITQVTDRKEGGGDDGTATVIDIQVHNKPLKPELFKFNKTGSVPFGSRREVAGYNEHPLIGHVAPSIELKTIDGKFFKLEDEKAEIVVFDFWATWCGPCIAALPDLQKLHKWANKEKKPIAIYAINVEETPEQAHQLWDKMKLTIPVLMDSKGEVRKSYQAKLLPSTFLIHGGQIVYVPDFVDFSRLKLVVEHFLGVEPTAGTDTQANSENH